jgi:biopolymer transport protein ExbD
MALQGHAQKSFGDINITPLTDIFLVLLIIMMVVAPMVSQSGKKLFLPHLQHTTPITDTQLATVEITDKGEVFVDGKVVQGVTPEHLEPFSQALQQSYQRHAHRTKSASSEQKQAPIALVVKADQATQAQWILATMTAAQTTKFEKLMLQATPAHPSR